MPAAAPIVPQRASRRARYLVPRDTPRRAEFLAALAVASLLAGVLLAPLTLIAALLLRAVGKAARWRPSWLLAPAGFALVWAVAEGFGGALAGLGSGPAALRAALAHAFSGLSTLGSVGRVPGIIAAGLGGQFPVALILAAGVAAAGWWLDWLHTDEWDLPAPRPGLVHALRWRWNAAFVKSGGAVTRQGACLGIDRETGGQAALSWREAAGGVLVTGAARHPVRATAFQLAHAAIRRRMPAVVVDLAADPALARELAAACEASGAPLHLFGADRLGCYEPVRGNDPARAAALVTGMIGCGSTPEPARRACQDYLAVAFAVLAALPADPAVAVLDLLAGLLRPGELRACADRIPSYLPGRQLLTERAAVAGQWPATDPATARLLASELTELRASALGRWLGPGPATSDPLRLHSVVSQRGAALFSLDAARHGRAAAMIANLVALDLSDQWARQQRLGFGSDGFAWFHCCDPMDTRVLAGLTAAGRGGLLATVTSTTSAQTAARLLGHAGAWVAHRVEDAELAGQLAALTGAKYTAVRPGMAPPAAAAAVAVPAGAAGTGAASVAGAAAGSTPVPAGPWVSPLVPAETLLSLADGEFVLAAGVEAGRARRVVAQGLSVTARVPPPVRGTAAPAVPPSLAGWPS